MFSSSNKAKKRQSRTGEKREESKYLRSAGCGMQNLNNTCFLNATLQALFHLPSYAKWLETKIVSCSTPDCILCAMKATLRLSRQSKKPFVPSKISNKLLSINKNFKPNQQEDAHEFMTYLLNAMANSHSQYHATSEYDGMFGGELQSTVTCAKCGNKSTTFQRFQDLYIDVHNSKTVRDSVKSYFSEESVTDYNCIQCNSNVDAAKQFKIVEGPPVLCVSLKKYSSAGKKFVRRLYFSKKLVLDKYSANERSLPLTYRLIAAVSHHGESSAAGHYTTIANTILGYYKFDDHKVTNITFAEAFESDPYLLLYERDLRFTKRKEALNNDATNLDLTITNNEIADESTTLSQADTLILDRTLTENVSKIINDTRDINIAEICEDVINDDGISICENSDLESGHQTPLCSECSDDSGQGEYCNPSGVDIEIWH